MGLEEAFDSAAQELLKQKEGQAEESPQGQEEAAPEPEANQPEGQAKSGQEAPEQKLEWDGNEESLPNALKQDPKSIQRSFTRLSMAKAEIEKKLKDYEGLNKAEIDEYRVWKQQQEIARQQQVLQNPPAPTQLTAEQLELIKNDPQAMTQYVNALVQTQLQQAAQFVTQDIQQLKHAHSVADWKEKIIAFSQEHPDMNDLHQAGILEPILVETIKNGGTLEDGYNKAAAIRDNIAAAQRAKEKELVAKKKAATTLSGTSTNNDDAVFAKDKNEAFEKAFDLAYQKKEYVPKDATVSPRGRVKIKK